jgi:hypothetical protein
MEPLKILKENQMTVTYTNRKGVTYTLCRTATKTGKPRYVFVRDPTDRETVEEIPEGWEIRESVNGVVSLAKPRERYLLSEEITAVKAALGEHPKAHNYRLDVKPERLVIYEREGPDIDGLLGIFGAHFGMSPGKEQQLRDELTQRGHFAQVLRFVLTDAKTRDFRAARRRTRGRSDDWIFMGSGKLADLVQTLVPKLGTDVFFNLY